MDASIKGLNAELKSYNWRLAIDISLTLVFLVSAIVLGIIARNDGIKALSLWDQYNNRPWWDSGVEILKEFNQIYGRCQLCSNLSMGSSIPAIGGIFLSIHTLIKRREVQAKIKKIKKL